MARETRVDRLGRPDLEAFVRELMASGRAPRSVARIVACVRGFYRFLLLDGHVAANPADDLRAPRSWPALPRFLSTADVDLLLDQPDTTTAIGIRDRALIELLYATGLRVSELVSLQPNDLHLDAGYLTCLGKGDKERLVPIGSAAVEWVRRYQRSARSALPRPTDFRPGLRERPRRGSAHPRRLLEEAQAVRAAGRAPAGPEPTRPAALVRDASARARRGSAVHSDSPRARRSVDHPDLYPHPRSAAEGRLRRVPSAGCTSDL